MVVARPLLFISLVLLYYTSLLTASALPQPQEGDMADVEDILKTEDHFADEDEDHQASEEDEDDHDYGITLKNLQFVVNDNLPPVAFLPEDNIQTDVEDAINLPDSYSSVDEGLVSPVQTQLRPNCPGASFAYATAAVVETCVKRVSGQTVSYSARQFMECGWTYDDSHNCRGAPIWSYLVWTYKENNVFVSDADFGSCDSVQLSQAGPAVVNSVRYTMIGTEEVLKEMVYKYGAVAVALNYTMATAKKLDFYDGQAVFDGCTDTDRTAGELSQAMTVVGYGTEAGLDYWLLKGIDGEGWGDRGYLRLRRGVKACGIGRRFATADCISLEECQKTAGCLKAVDHQKNYPAIERAKKSRDAA